jgi:hypothetical protein
MADRGDKGLFGLRPYQPSPGASTSPPPSGTSVDPLRRRGVLIRIRGTASASGGSGRTTVDRMTGQALDDREAALLKELQKHHDAPPP